ncbi:MAG: hypothetical protein SVX38_02040 [Chloroflexota bacterium]|nr:hypothetical protein [Chloroflexota bacterium]
MDEVVFWGIAYACLLVATGAYLVVLWKGMDVAALVGRLTGALGAVLMTTGLILRLARTGRWFLAGSGEIAVAAVMVAVIVFLGLERWRGLRGDGAGVFLLAVLLDSFALWSLVIRGEGDIPLVAGGGDVLVPLRVALDVVAYGCLLAGGGVGLVRAIPARWPVAGRPSADALDAEAWRAFAWGVSALSGGLVIGALAAYLAGLSLWSPESGLLWSMAVWAVCGGVVAVRRSG